MNKTIVVTGVEPAPLSIRHPLGINLDLIVTMKTQRGTFVNPTLAQFVLLPRSKGGVYPFDMEPYDVVNGQARVQVPGLTLTDNKGYSIELYLRKEAPNTNDPPVPTSLAAKGALIPEGSAYMQEGPLGLINVPIVVGPVGPTGAAGRRGSIWFTGVGVPTLTDGILVGDMYLDETSGDVWRYSGEVWMKGAFS